MPREAGYSPAPIPNTSLAHSHISHICCTVLFAKSYTQKTKKCPCTYVHGHDDNHDVCLFQEAAQPTGNARVTEFAERFAFDLAGAFAGDAEFATDFFEGA